MIVISLVNWNVSATTTFSGGLAKIFARFVIFSTETAIFVAVEFQRKTVDFTVEFLPSAAI